MSENPTIVTATGDRAEVRDLVRRQLEALLTQGNFTGAKALLQPVLPVDIAEAIEGLPETMQAIAFRLLNKAEAIEVYEYLDSSVQQALIEEFRSHEVREIVEQMSPDDRVRLFDELPAKFVRQLLQQLSPEERHVTAQLLGYEVGTAGRIMTPEYIALKEAMTVQAALEDIRRLATRTETIYTLYVVDASRRLSGILSLRELVVAQPDQVIGAIMTRDVVSVHTDLSQEEAARIIQRYDFLAVPVVDREERLVGIVTVDDVMDILEEEVTKDIYTLGGVQSGEENDYFESNLWTVAQRRVVWLLILLLTNAATSYVIRTQENVLTQVVALAAFVPLLIGTGGNVGAQSSTVVIRGLSTEQLDTLPAGRVISRESIAGALLGLILAVLVTGWAYLLQGNLPMGERLGVALSVGASLFIISTLASTAGAALPLVFKRVGWDPALMSSPFITTVVDVLGVFIYFKVARAILHLAA